MLLIGILAGILTTAIFTTITVAVVNDPDIIDSDEMEKAIKNNKEWNRIHKKHGDISVV